MNPEEIILKKEELDKKIMSAINESKLPALIIRPVLEGFLAQIIKLEGKQSFSAHKIQEKKEKTKKKGGAKNG